MKISRLDFSHKDALGARVVQRECAKNHVVPLAFSESVLITFLATLSEKSFWDLLFRGWWLGTCRRTEPRCQRWDGATQKDTAETLAAGGFSVRSSPPACLAEKHQAGACICFAVYYKSLPRHNGKPNVEHHINNILYLCSTLHL